MRPDLIDPCSRSARLTETNRSVLLLAAGRTGGYFCVPNAGGGDPLIPAILKLSSAQFAYVVGPILSPSALIDQPL
jgi:hypothetical protein